MAKNIYFIPTAGGGSDGVSSGATLINGILTIQRTEGLIDLSVDLTPLSGGSTNRISSNGITLLGDEYQLGGSLKKGTTIGGNDRLKLRGGLSFDYSEVDNNNSLSTSSEITDATVAGTGANSIVAFSYAGGVVAITGTNVNSESIGFTPLISPIGFTGLLDNGSGNFTGIASTTSTPNYFTISRADGSIYRIDFNGGDVTKILSGGDIVGGVTLPNTINFITGIDDTILFSRELFAIANDGEVYVIRTDNGTSSVIDVIAQYTTTQGSIGALLPNASINSVDNIILDNDSVLYSYTAVGYDSGLFIARLGDDEAAILDGNGLTTTSTLFNSFDDVIIGSVTKVLGVGYSEFLVVTDQGYAYVIELNNGDFTVKYKFTPNDFLEGTSNNSFYDATILDDGISPKSALIYDNGGDVYRYESGFGFSLFYTGNLLNSNQIFGSGTKDNNYYVGESATNEIVQLSFTNFQIETSPNGFKYPNTYIPVLDEELVTLGYLNDNIPDISPAGNSTEVQFNTDGSFDAVSDFTFDKSIRQLDINGDIAISGTSFIGSSSDDISSIRIGENSFANSGSAIAIGENSSATTLNSLAIGQSSLVCGGNNGIAIGWRASTVCGGGISFGTNTKSSGQNGINIGFETGNKLTSDPEEYIYQERSISIGWRTNFGSSIGEDSIAMGRYAKTPAIDSIAIGCKSSATGDFNYDNPSLFIRNIAIGDSATASGGCNVALGFNSLASGRVNVAIGNLSRVLSPAQCSMAIGGFARVISGECSIAMGRASYVCANKSMALGAQSCVVNGCYGTAIGLCAKASGACSTAIGIRSIAGGNSTTGAFAIGNQAKAYGANALSIGGDNYANGSGTVALGRFNDAIGILSHAIGSSNSSYTNSWTIGNTNTTTSIKTFAIGCSNDVYSSCSTAIGFDNLICTGGSCSTLLGISNCSNEINTTLVGWRNCAISGACRSVAFGTGNRVCTRNSSLFGQYNRIDGDGFNNVAIGRANRVTSGESAIAIGVSTLVSGENALGVGRLSKSYGLSSIAIGDQAHAYAPIQISIGRCAGCRAVPAEGTVCGVNSMSIGIGVNSDNSYLGTQSITIGNLAGNNSDFGISLGGNACVLTGSTCSIAIGRGANVDFDSPDSIAFGRSAIVQDNSNESIAIGRSAGVSGNCMISIGTRANILAQTRGDGHIGIGYQINKFRDVGCESIAIGFCATSECPQSVSLGRYSCNQAYRGISIGNRARVGNNAPDGIAIGVNTNTLASGGTIIGYSHTLSVCATDSSILGGHNVTVTVPDVSLINFKDTGFYIDNLSGYTITPKFAIFDAPDIGTTGDSVLLRSSDGKVKQIPSSTLISGGGSGTPELTPAGNPDEVQFNDNGALGADSDFRWNQTTSQLRLSTTSSLAFGTTSFLRIGSGGITTLELGQNATTNGGENVSIGNAASACACAIALGSGSNAHGARSVTIGIDAISSAAERISIGARSGSNTDTFGANAINIGTDTASYSTCGACSISIGLDSNCGIQVGNDSIAVGRNSKTLSDIGIAIGASALVTGSSSISIGRNNNLNAIGECGGFSVNLGFNNNNGNAIGCGSIGVGRFVKNSGNNSIAIGSSAAALTASTISIGAQSDAVGVCSIALGASAQANGFGSTAIGFSSKVASNVCCATAIGFDNDVSLSLYDEHVVLKKLAVCITPVGDDTDNVLVRDGFGIVKEVSRSCFGSAGSTATSPAGNEGDLQFNNSGSFGANTNLNWNGTNLDLKTSLFLCGNKFLATNAKQSIAIGSGATIGNLRNGIAIGKNSTISQSRNIAIGYNSLSSCFRTMAIGTDSIVTGNSGMAIGYKSSASRGSVAIGYQVAANCFWSINIGCESTSNGIRSISIGNINTFNSNSGVNIGNDNIALDGCQRVVLVGGRLNNCGDYSVLIGDRHENSGFTSTIIGGIGNSISSGSSNIAIVGLVSENVDSTYDNHTIVDNLAIRSAGSATCATTDNVLIRDADDKVRQIPLNSFTLGSGTSVAGNDREIQFNDGGSLGATSNFKFTGNTLDIGGGNQSIAFDGNDIIKQNSCGSVSFGCGACILNKTPNNNNVVVYGVAVGDGAIAQSSNSISIGRNAGASNVSNAIFCSGAISIGAGANGACVSSLGVGRNSVGIGTSVRSGGDYSVVVGGGFQCISNSACQSTILGGDRNKLYASGATLIGGRCLSIGGTFKDRTVIGSCSGLGILNVNTGTTCEDLLSIDGFGRVNKIPSSCFGGTNLAVGGASGDIQYNDGNGGLAGCSFFNITDGSVPSLNVCGSVSAIGTTTSTLAVTGNIGAGSDTDKVLVRDGDNGVVREIDQIVIKELPVFYVNGNNETDGIGSVVDPFRTLDLAYDAVVGTGSASNPENNGITIRVAGSLYSTDLNLAINGVTWLFEDGSIVDYTGTNYLFDLNVLGNNQSFNVFGNAAFTTDNGGFINAIGVNNTSNGNNKKLTFRADSLTSNLVNTTNPNEKPLIVVANYNGGTSSLDLEFNLRISSLTQTIVTATNNSNFSIIGNGIQSTTTVGRFEQPEPTEDVRLFDIQSSFSALISNFSMFAYNADAYIQIGDDSTTISLGRVIFQDITIRSTTDNSVIPARFLNVGDFDRENYYPLDESKLIFKNIDYLNNLFTDTTNFIKYLPITGNIFDNLEMYNSRLPYPIDPRIRLNKSIITSTSSADNGIFNDLARENSIGGQFNISNVREGSSNQLLAIDSNGFIQRYTGGTTIGGGGSASEGALGAIQYSDGAGGFNGDTTKLSTDGCGIVSTGNIKGVSACFTSLPNSVVETYGVLTVDGNGKVYRGANVGDLGGGGITNFSSDGDDSSVTNVTQLNSSNPIRTYTITTANSGGRVFVTFTVQVKVSSAGLGGSVELNSGSVEEIDFGSFLGTGFVTSTIGQHNYRLNVRDNTTIDGLSTITHSNVIDLPSGVNTIRLQVKRVDNDLLMQTASGSSAGKFQVAYFEF